MKKLLFSAMMLAVAMTASAQQVCVCTFKDKMVFGEGSPFKTHKTMLTFFR